MHRAFDQRLDRIMKAAELRAQSRRITERMHQFPRVNLQYQP